MALTADVNPSYTKIDPFWGSASAIDEVCRNLASVGAVPHSFADCLNFGNPEKPERLGELYSSAKALGYVAKELEIPFVSGNVSLYNEAPYGSIPPTPAILGLGIVSDIRKCVTVDMKKEGNSIYLIGDNKKEKLPQALGNFEHNRSGGRSEGIAEENEFIDLCNPKRLNSILPRHLRGWYSPMYG